MNIRLWWNKADNLDLLLLVNALVFLLVQVFHLLGDGFGFHWIVIHPDLFLAATDDLSILVKRPWSILTHMFTHVHFGHVIFNMFALYTAGKLFRHFADSRKLVTLYLLGGLTGLTFFLLSSLLFHASDAGGYYLGASAATMAIVLAIGTLRPDFIIKLFGVFEMRLIWLCGILILVDLISIQKGFNSGGHIGHIGGAVFGWFYAYNYKKGKHMASWLDRFIQKIASVFSGSSRNVSSAHRRPKSDEEFNAEKKKRQQRVDQILDKISRSGYESLSKEEKDFLFKYSQK